MAYGRVGAPDMQSRASLGIAQSDLSNRHLGTGIAGSACSSAPRGKIRNFPACFSFTASVRDDIPF
jgi:hypothetical protein